VHSVAGRAKRKPANPAAGFAEIGIGRWHRNCVLAGERKALWKAKKEEQKTHARVTCA
jgi:hypothetical protein